MPTQTLVLSQTKIEKKEERKKMEKTFTKQSQVEYPLTEPSTKCSLIECL